MENASTRQNIPSGWKFGELGNFLADIGDGGTPSRAKSEYFGGEIPWVVVGDIKPHIKKTKETLTNEGLQKSSAKLWPIGSVILSFGATIGEVGIADVPVATKQGIAGIVPNDDLLNIYLYYVLLSKKDLLHKLSSGSTIKEVRPPVIKKQIEVLIPPIKEQQKIAEILGTVDEDIAKTQELIAATEELKRGLMQDIFSFKNRDDVECLALGALGRVAMCKRIFREETSPIGEIPFYKIGTFGKEPDAFIPKKLFDKYRAKFSFPMRGDVLLSASGTIGRMVKYDGRPAYFQDSNIIWLEHDESKILNDFLFYLYQTITWLTEGSTIKRLYNSILLKKVVPVPSVGEQKKIVEILSSIDEKISVNNELKAKLTLLKKGLMQDLLSGKVRTISY